MRREAVQAERREAANSQRQRRRVRAGVTRHHHMPLFCSKAAHAEIEYIERGRQVRQKGGNGEV